MCVSGMGRYVAASAVTFILCTALVLLKFTYDYDKVSFGYKEWSKLNLYSFYMTIAKAYI